MATSNYNDSKRISTCEYDQLANESDSCYSKCEEDYTQKKLLSTSCSTESIDDCGNEDSTSDNYPNFVKKFENIENEDLVCLICQMVAIDPKQSQCCGKIYCKKCVSKLIRRSAIPKCPTCRKYGVVFFDDKRASRAIMGLMVYCNQKEKGCKWQGTLSDFSMHLELCTHRLVLCPNDCQKTLRHYRLSKHLTRSCPNRDINCNYCGQSGQWTYITGDIHAQECTGKLVVCENEGCNEKIKRNSQVMHQLVCPKKIISCSYEDIGCTVIFKREDSAKHAKSNKQQHFEYALKRARRPFIQPDHLCQTTPLVVCVDGLEHANVDHRSQPFLTSFKGYKMSLLVRERNEHSLNIFMCMMACENDKNLQWPFEGNITVELLNQLEDKQHLEFSADVFVVKDSYYTMKDKDSKFYKGIEIGYFDIPIDNSGNATDGYIVDGCVYFRVWCIDNNYEED